MKRVRHEAKEEVNKQLANQKTHLHGAKSFLVGNGREQELRVLVGGAQVELARVQNDSAKVGINDGCAQAAQLSNEAAKELGHEAVDDAVQGGVVEQTVAKAAEIAVQGREDAVREHVITQLHVVDPLGHEALEQRKGARTR